MSLILIVKLLVVIFFLIMFLRRPSVAWGVGLLTVTTAILLDTLLNTFDHVELQAEFGFFYYVVAGALFGGAAIWLWGVLRPFLNPSQPQAYANNRAKPQTAVPAASSNPSGGNNSAVDRQMVFDQIRTRFGYEDVLDLMFDMGINENDVMSLDQNINDLIIRIMDQAELNGQSGALALAVERILTPMPPENLPRLEKINADSPPTVLRQYLLAHYNLAELEQIAVDLDVDWEELGLSGKKGKVRNLLLYLYRRNRINELIDLMRLQIEPPASPEPTAQESDA